MSSEETLDALIKRVASVHGIALSQDDPILILHTLNEVLLEKNEQAHVELLSNYQSVLEDSFNKWCTYSTDKSNAMINASTNQANQIKEQFIENCIQQIDEKIKNEVTQEIIELARTARQAAIINLLAAVLVLVSVIVVLVTLR